MDQPLITVIIPVYNMELYLERCLDSVLNNTYRNLEVICVDDGSKDCSLEILRRYEAADSRIVLITKENGGVSSARNAGLDRMTGEYVTFVDPDDFVHPQYIEILYYAITKTNADLVMTEPSRVYPEDFPIQIEPVSISSIDPIRITKLQVYRNKNLRAYTHCKIVKCSVVGSCRFPLGYKVSEDIIFYASIWENNPSMSCYTLSAPVYFYHQGNPNSAVTNANEHDMLKATKYCVERCAISRENEQIYLFMVIEQGLWHRYYGSEIRGDRTIRKVANPLLLRSWRMMIISPHFTLREKVTMTVKIFAYPIYLVYCRRNPVFRNWEQAEKEKNGR